MNAQSNHRRIIAFDIRPHSFGFAILEGPNELLDYGVRSFRSGMNTVQVPPMQKLVTLLDDFQPHAVVRNRCASNRNNWASLVTRILEQEARKRRISVASMDRGTVRKLFVGNDRNKHEIASALAQRFPVLASKLPPKRKCWQSEDYRMSIFDAAALGTAYFCRG